MGISQTGLSNIERGRTRATLKNLFKIRDLLGCSMGDFFEDTAEKETFDMKEIMEAMQLIKKIKLENKGEVC